jgi:RimJ/RimL family protein N-acetyltransferase
VNLELRAVEADDLPILFEHQADPVASELAGIPSRDREAFDAHWVKVLRDPSVIVRTIVVDGKVVGAVQSWPGEGERLTGYWIGREFWGRGIASAAMAKFLAIDRQRPLEAHVAKTNPGSIRVLQKSGFELEREEDDGYVFLLAGER